MFCWKKYIKKVKDFIYSLLGCWEVMLGTFFLGVSYMCKGWWGVLTISSPSLCPLSNALSTQVPMAVTWMD